MINKRKKMTATGKCNCGKICNDCVIKEALRRVADLAAQMRRVILESPYSGNVKENIAYAKRCVKDSLKRGEAPIVSHLLFTREGILDDKSPRQRALGIAAGHAWIAQAELMVVYEDRGISHGMELGMKQATALGIQIEKRKIE